MVVCRPSEWDQYDETDETPLTLRMPTFQISSVVTNELPHPIVTENCTDSSTAAPAA